jgi:cytochrome c oxidase subunit II
MFLIMSLSLLLIGCSSETIQVESNNKNLEFDLENAKELTMDASNWKFEASDVTINKGDSVRLIVNGKQGNHGLAIPELGIATGRIEEGGQQVIEFVAKKSGNYKYFCNVPCGHGHRDMKGFLKIE